MVTFKGNLFAFGGSSSENTEGALSTVERYEPNKDVWMNVTPMSTARGDLAATVLGDHVYVCGGLLSGYLQSCECYDPAQDQWQKVANMNHRRAGHCLVAVHGQLYALGGDDGSLSNSVESYIPIEDKWTLLDAPLRLARIYSSAVVLPGTHLCDR